MHGKVLCQHIRSSCARLGSEKSSRVQVTSCFCELGLFGRQTHPSQALLQGVQDDELGEVEVLLRGFSKYPLRQTDHIICV